MHVVFREQASDIIYQYEQSLEFLYSLKIRQLFWSCKIYSSNLDKFKVFTARCEDIYGHYCIQKWQQ